MRVMVVSHGWPPHAQGGAEIYAAFLSKALVDRGVDVVALVREADPRRPDGAVRDETRDRVRIRWVNNTFSSARDFVDSYVDPAITQVAVTLAEQSRPDVVHVHHLTCLSTTLVPALAALGMPVVVTLRDYWLMCHRGQLLDLDLRRCDGPGSQGCGRCVGAAGAPDPLASVARHVHPWLPLRARDLARRTLARGASWLPADATRTLSARRSRHMRGIGASVSIWLAPSVHIRDRFIAFGLPADRLCVSEYGTDLRRFAPGRGPAPTPPPLRIGFLGSLMPSKAPHLLLEAYDALPPGRATVDLYGRHVPYHGDDSYRSRLAAWRRSPGITFHDPVAHEEVPSVMAAMDVLVVPSIWEENSPLVIREALAMAIPVVASRIGGVPETIDHERNGLLFPPGDVGALGQCLRRLAEERGLLERLRENIRPPRSLDEAADDTLAFLERAIESGRRQPTTAAHRSTPMRVAAVVLNHAAADESVIALRSVRASGDPVDLIVVDNGDGRSLGRVLADVRDPVVPLVTGTNLGFSGGCNVGIREALARGAEAVLLLNSDVVVPPGTIDVLSGVLAARPDAGIVAPVVMSRAEPAVVASAGMDYSPRSGRMRHRLAGSARADVAIPEWQQVDGVSGCAMLIRRVVFERAGLLPEDYFFSFEDLAYCLRARREGFAVGVTGSAAVFHEGSASIGAGSPRRFYFAARNHLRLADENARLTGVGRAIHQASVLALNLAHAVRRDRVPFPARVTAVLRGGFDYVRGRVGDGP